MAQTNFTVETVVGNSGGRVQVPVIVDDFNQVAGFEFQISYPFDKATFLEISETHLGLGGGGELFYDDLGGGIVDVLWLGPLTGPVTIGAGEVLFNVELEITTTESVPILVSLENLILGDELGQSIEATTTAGNVLVNYLLIDAADVIAGVNGIVDVPVTAKNFINVAGLQFDVDFDATKATFVSIEDPNNALTGFGSQNYFSPTPGKLKVLWDEPGLINTTIDDDELLFNLRFRVADKPSDPFPVSIDQLSVFDNQPKTILSAADPGSITILDFVNVSGNISNESGDVVPGVTINLLSLSDSRDTLSDAAGDFNFEVLPGKDYIIEPEKAGNIINGINVADILFIRRHLLGVNVFSSPYKIIAADVDLSNQVDVADIIVLRKVILQMQDQLSKNWRFIPSDYVFSDNANPFVDVFPENRTLINLSDAKPDQDFIAIKVGDVNDNHDVSARIASNATVKLEIPDKATIVNGEVRVPVKVVSGYADIMGWQSTFDFDPSVLSFSHIESGAIKISEFNSGTSQIAAGKLSFVYDQPDLFSDHFSQGMTLFHLVFDVTGKEGSETRISAGPSLIPLKVYKSDLRDGNMLEIAGGSVSVSGLSLDVFPNPGTIFNISFQVPENEEVQIRALDINGQVVSDESKSFEEGAHVISYDASQLKDGIYFMEAIVNNQRFTEKIIVRK